MELSITVLCFAEGKYDFCNKKLPEETDQFLFLSSETPDWNILSQMQ